MYFRRKNTFLMYGLSLFWLIQNNRKCTCCVKCTNPPPYCFILFFFSLHSSAPFKKLQMYYLQWIVDWASCWNFVSYIFFIDMYMHMYFDLSTLQLFKDFLQMYVLKLCLYLSFTIFLSILLSSSGLILSAPI